MVISYLIQKDSIQQNFYSVYRILCAVRAEFVVWFHEIPNPPSNGLLLENMKVRKTTIFILEINYGLKLESPVGRKCWNKKKPTGEV